MASTLDGTAVDVKQMEYILLSTAHPTFPVQLRRTRECLMHRIPTANSSIGKSSGITGWRSGIKLPESISTGIAVGPEAQKPFRALLECMKVNGLALILFVPIIVRDLGPCWSMEDVEYIGCLQIGWGN